MTARLPSDFAGVPIHPVVMLHQAGRCMEGAKSVGKSAAAAKTANRAANHRLPADVVNVFPRG